MNRLTNHKKWSDDIDLTNEYGHKHIYDRLAEYENTGLMPDEINGWTSVDERLPITVGEYICYVKFSLIPDKVMVVRYEKVFYMDKVESWIISGLVTHWMPLPEPPKGELK